MDYAEFKKKFGISDKQAVEKPHIKPDGEFKLGDTTPATPTEPLETPTTPATPPVQPITPEKTGLAAMSKKELLEYIEKRGIGEYIGKKKLFEKPFKDLEPDAIIPLFLKAVQAKVVEAKLKTAEEAAAMAESELLALLDTLK
jgi:hypothetical protein